MMPEFKTLKCKCGWQGNVVKGKILSINCPGCGKRIRMGAKSRVGVR